MIQNSLVKNLARGTQWARRLLPLSMAALLLMQTPTQAQTAPAAPNKVNPITGVAPDASWKEEFAYTLGTQAYVYAFPWEYNALMRWRWANVPQVNTSTEFGLPNELAHQRKLTDASWRAGGRPNNDTLYSAAYTDLTKEPMIVTVPDMGERYFSVQLVGFDGDNFDYIGTRATGNRGGKYALVGPNWKGTLPAGVKAVATAHTNWILVLFRILVDGPEEYPTVHALQDKISMVPLSQYLGGPVVPRMDKSKLAPPVNRKSPDPLHEWKVLNRLLTESPPPAREAQMMKMFAQIGVGPNLDVEKMDEATKRGLVRALQAGRMIATSAPANNAGRTSVNQWGIEPDNWGRTGKDGDYLVRDAQTLGGFVVHDPIENVYPALLTDNNGEPLSESHRYELHFAKGELPQAKAFWSLTLYDNTFCFVDNPINRYAVGNRSKDMKLDPDGGLTIYIQRDPPGNGKDGNWLPSRTPDFHLVIRMYLPTEAVLSGKWQPPPIKRVD